jgi:spore germination protein GerM
MTLKMAGNSFIRIITYFILIIIGGGVIYLIFLNFAEKSDGLSRFDHKVTSTRPQHMEKAVVHLYFADKENRFLIAEKRVIPHPDDPATFGNIIVQELIKGPREGLMRTVPEDTVLQAFYLTHEGTAFVDITEAVVENHPGGIKLELITIYSIVNSLILNIPAIDAVKILIGGREALTLAGHVDLRFPFKANMLLIR